MHEVKRLRQFVGGGYDEFWRFKGRYRIVKGSRASKKSKTTALWYMSQLSKEQYNQANLLVVRRTYRTLKDSCFAELKWAINRLGLQAVWHAKESPLEIENILTGQKVYFRGLDDPLKITSITVEHGCLCWLWIEEAYEIADEETFDTLDESIRGEVPPPLFKQTTLTFNPWSETHWMKARFFDHPQEDVLAVTTNYTCNEWLDDTDRRMFERMKRENPRRYRVAGLGDWGVADGLIFDNWTVEDFSIERLLFGDGGDRLKCIFGLDYGYSNDPTAFIAAAVDPVEKVMYIFDEHYKTRMVNSEIAAMIKEKGYAKERIRADSAEPKSNEELRRAGISRVQPAEKGKDSILHGIAALQEYRMIVHPVCKATIAELSSY
ncbi:MAG: PBSX family phage terminase large subunit, partial [Clostridia bacterium]|nr:PBSX family phage terminase large subunit [Clostridia bacterium]